MNTPVFSLVLIAMVALVAGTAPVHADDVTCPPNIGEVTIKGNLHVSGDCELHGTVVEGSVALFAGGSLLARGAQIKGNLQTEDDAFEVDIVDTRVGGNVQLDNLVGDESFIEASEIGGNIQVTAIRSALQINGNDVGGNVHAFDNTGGIDISANVIDGNLQCDDNSPAPTGSVNDVAGNKEDQCTDLEPAPEGTLRTPVPEDDSNATGGGGGSTGILFLGILAILAGTAPLVRRSGRAFRTLPLRD